MRVAGLVVTWRKGERAERALDSQPLPSPPSVAMPREAILRGPAVHALPPAETAHVAASAGRVGRERAS